MTRPVLVRRPRRTQPLLGRIVAAVAVALLACAASLAGPTPPAGAARGSIVCASPVEPMRVVALARLPAHDWLPGHRGIDLDSTVGQEVFAPAAGTVSFAGVVVDRPVVSIRHANGFVSSVEPVVATVAVGDGVRAGDPVGAVAPTRGHCAPATCVHWGLRLNGVYVNPLDYLEGFGPVRLLPLSRS